MKFQSNPANNPINNCEKKKKKKLMIIKKVIKKNKKKKKNVKKEDRNFQKHIINLERRITCQLVKNLINLYKKSKKKLTKINMIKISMHSTKKNQKRADVEEENGIKLIMSSRMKL